MWPALATSGRAKGSEQGQLQGRARRRLRQHVCGIAQPRSGGASHPPGRRFTAPTVRTAYQYPAGHLVDVGGSGDAGWMGMRARVRAAFPCWALQTFAARIICRGLKQYGLILADVGSSWYLTGEAAPAWEQRFGPNFDQCEFG